MIVWVNGNKHNHLHSVTEVAGMEDDSATTWRTPRTQKRKMPGIFPTSLPPVVPDLDDHHTGRYLRIQFKWNDTLHTLINLYAPAEGNASRESFFNHYNTHMHQINNHPLTHTLVAGDMNTVPNHDVDVESLTGHIPYQNVEYDAFRLTHSLLDSYQETPGYGEHDFKVQFTFATSSGYKARIDQIHNTGDLYGVCHPIHTPREAGSDHQPVTVRLGPDNSLPPTKLGRDLTYVNVDTLLEPSVLANNAFILKAAYGNATALAQLDPRWYRDSTPYTTYFLKALAEVVNNCTRHARRNSRKTELIQHKQVLKNPQSTPDQLHAAHTSITKLHTAACRGAAVRAKADQIDLDEKSTRYFFQKEKARGQAALIDQVVVSSSDDHSLGWHSTIPYTKDTRKEVEEEFVNFYEDLYAHKQTDLVSEQVVMASLTKWLHDPTNSYGLPQDTLQELQRDFTAPDIRRAVNATTHFKSPGSDSIPTEFYEIHGELFCAPPHGTVTEDHIDLYHWMSLVHTESLEIGRLPETARRIITRLLFKKLTTFEKCFRDNWRPISLLQTYSRVFSKVLQQRMIKVMHYIVPNFQTAGDEIGEAIFPVQSAIHLMNAKRTPAGKVNTTTGGLLFVDFRKAFDSVQHSFIDRVLRTFGFPDRFVDMLMLSYKDMSAQLIVNGYLTRPFSLRGGGRQGDPVFPLVFNLIMVSFGLLIEQDLSIQGVELASNTKIKQRQYVDDCLGFIPSPYEYHRHLHHLDTFCAASGMEANFEKTHGLLLGTWRLSPPLELLPSEKHPIQWKSDSVPIKHLGISVGNDVPHHITVETALGKVRAAAAHR